MAAYQRWLPLINYENRQCGLAACKALMQAGGVIGTLKHFVGLGAVPHGNANDPHFTLPSVDLTPDQLNTDLIPFKHFVQSPNKLDHPGFIMPTDLMVPSVDPKYPTEFSHTFITDILRNQIGYTGQGGVAVYQVVPGSPADKAGIQPGDVILQADGKPYSDFTQLHNYIGTKKPGDTIRMDVWSQGRKKFVAVKLAENPAGIPVSGQGP